MKIAIGADHAGFEFKEQLKEYISSLGYDVKDVELISTQISNVDVKKYLLT